MSSGSHLEASAATGLGEGLRAAGVRRMFGMPGGGPNLDMIGAAAAHGIPFTLAHGETAACVMAGVFGLLTGAPGVAVVTRGPGLTSAVNGLAQANLDQAPLLLLADRVPAEQRDRIAHQRLDQLAVTGAVTRWNGVLGHRDPAATLAAAAALTLGPPPGAVHLDFDPGLPGDMPAAPKPALPAGLAAALAVARGRRRPLVVLGVGAVAHAAGLRRVLGGADVPTLCTYQAAGTIDGTEPDAAGLFTNSAVERPLLDAADLVIGVGLDPVEPLPGAWDLAAPTVLVTPTPLDTAYFGSPAVVVGPPAEALRALLAACSAAWPSAAGRQHREAVLAALAGDGSGRNGSGGAGRALGEGLRPVDLVLAVRRLAGDAWLTVDAGAHMLAAMPFWPVRRPHGALISNGLSTMGYALPAAIGAALARPGERVVCLTGDGGLGMVLAELETLARLALPVTVVVFDDAALTLIALKQRSQQGGSAAVAYTPIDFAGLATAMGVPAASVDDTAGIEAALRGAGPGPFLLHARVDPTSYRHVMAVSRG